MSKFRQLVESILLEADLLEGFVPSKAPVANLVNKLYTSLIGIPFENDQKQPLFKGPLKIKLASVGRDKHKRDEIVSYYLNITAIIPHIIRGIPVDMAITIKCRCSTHDKPNQEEDPPKDINVFVPDPKNPKPIWRNGIACYDLTNDKNIDKYVAEGRRLIRNTIINKHNHLYKAFEDIQRNNQMCRDLLNLTDQELVSNYHSLNYGNIFYEDYFKSWLSNFRDKYKQYKKERPHN